MLDRAFGHPLEHEEKAAIPFAGGIQQHGYQCGMIWGAALAAGAEAHRRFGAGPEAEARSIEASRALVEVFRPRYGEIDCYEITHLDRESSSWDQFKFFMLKGGTIGCFKMASWYAPRAKEAIEGALEGTADDTTSGPEADSQQPVSCAAYLARTMGASEKHAMMASGLAGGIGLCGGACGALGTAIWLKTMKTAEEGGKIDFKDAGTQEIIDAFLKTSDFEFECSKIVGRVFESVDDHAEFVRGGGCAGLLEGLSSPND